MNSLQKRIHRFIAIILIFTMIMGQFAVPMAVFAEEVQTEQIVEQPSQEETQPPEEPNDPSESQESQSTAISGNATSTATTHTTTNTAIDEIEGEGEPTDCGVDIEGECPVEHTQQADVNADTDSTAQTGGTTHENNTGDATTQTGNADSQATSTTITNTSIVEVITPEEDGTEEAEGTASDAEELTEEDPENNTIQLTKEADVDTDTNALAITGGTTTEAEDDAKVTTGDAIASAQGVSVTNTNVIGSEFEILLLELFGNENGDIDLNKVWKNIDNLPENADELTAEELLDIIISNYAEVNAHVRATAVSGQNNATGGDTANIETGNAYANAGALNITNTNIIGSIFLFAIINIFGDFKGNIILPSPERFAENSITGSTANPHEGNNTTTDIAHISSTADAYADTGSEAVGHGGDTSAISGEAISYASSTSITNLKVFLMNWYFLILNNFGIWDGEVLGWTDPTARSAQSEQTVQYANDNPIPSNPDPAMLAEGTSDLSDGATENAGSELTINNEAHLNTSAIARAICGQNKAEGIAAHIKTGRCIAFANIFNITNSSFVGSRMLLPIITLFGSWTGNLIFAYPDLSIDIASNESDVERGDSITYTVSYMNNGYEEARDGTVTIDIPAEELFVGSHEHSAHVSGNSLSFDIGTVQPHEGGSFTFTTVVNMLEADASSNESLLSKVVHVFIKPVQADSDSMALVTTATIGSPDSESDTSNNESSTTKYLMLNNTTSDGASSTDQSKHDPTDFPEFALTASHNVHEYVLPGDTVTFQVQVKNIGRGYSNDTKLVQTIYDGNGAMLGQRVLDIQRLGPDEIKGGSLGLQLAQFVTGGTYTSVIQVEGRSTGGMIYASDTVTQHFDVRGNDQGHIPFVESAHAAELDTGKTAEAVLGDVAKQCVAQKDYLPYVLTTALALMWFVEARRRRQVEKELLLALKKLPNTKE